MIYASSDPVSFEITRQLHLKEWEVITFDDIDKAKQYLLDTEFLPHVILAIDLGHDDHIAEFINHVSKDFPGIKTALQILSRNPDTQIHQNTLCDLSFSENDTPSNIIQALEGVIE